MQNINLSKRLRAIASLVPLSGGIVDVGTDHGYIPVWLLQNGLTGPVYATDINVEPLERARNTAAAHGLSDSISFCHCDGLQGLEDNCAETVIIAGMGGETIAAILESAPWTRNTLLILQPMSKSERLRSRLFESGYRVLSEALVDDGAIYEIITATGGSDCPYSPAELLTGHTGLAAQDPLFPQRLQSIINRTKRAIEGLERASTSDNSARLEGLKENLIELTSMQKSLNK